MAVTLHGRPLVAGEAAGELLAATEPLSFWGGYDQTTGEIIDRRHPLSGRNAAGVVLALPAARGSSTTAAVLLEAVRRDTAPAALLTDGVDTFFTLAAIVAEQMYGRTLPVVALRAEDFGRLRCGLRARVHADGRVDLIAAGQRDAAPAGGDADPGGERRGPAEVPEGGAGPAASGKPEEGNEAANRR